jgi:hypothetical protein
MSRDDSRMLGFFLGLHSHGVFFFYHQSITHLHLARRRGGLLFLFDMS